MGPATKCKRVGPCSKIIEDLKMVTAEHQSVGPCGTAQVAGPRSQPSLSDNKYTIDGSYTILPISQLTFV